MHRNSWKIFERYGVGYIGNGDRVLEIGPDGFPSTYQSGITAAVACWETLDFAGRPGVTYGTEDPYHFPIRDDSYDVVLSGQVIEHVPKTWRWMPELARVTRPGGVVITVAPISWPYHEAPVDCWRIYPDGLKALYDDAGLTVELAEWGSVELEPVVRRLPKPLQRQALWQQLSTSILLLHNHAPVRTQGAFDTIVVGRKP